MRRVGYTLKSTQGFTIVELLIVVVVIAILAAITIVGYNGISNRATEAAAQSGASSAAKKIATFAIDNGEQYPSSTAALSDIGLVNTNESTYQYTVNNAAKTYCLTYVFKAKPYYVSESQTTPTSGVCSGHNADGIANISNIVLNPSAESASPTYGGPNSSTVAFSTTRAHSGTRSLVVTMPIFANSNVGIVAYKVNDLSGDIKPNTNYTASAYVYVPSGTVDLEVSIQGTARAILPQNPERLASVKNQWVRIWRPITTTSAGTVQFYILNYANTTTAGTQFWVDDIMVTEGTTPPLYADGSSSGWSWSGTPHSSISSGKPL